MKLPKPSIQLFLILLFLTAAGCAPITPYPGGGGSTGTSHPGGEIGTTGGGSIGILRTSGPNVYLNGSPAIDGAPVYLGNSVATGAGSSAKVEFDDGGYLQLDENTDPLFEWLEQSKCLLIKIVKGQVYLKKSHTCVEGPDISMILNSEVNLNIPPPPAPSEVTVIRGTADIILPTRRIKLVKGQQLTAIVKAPEVKTLSPDVLNSLGKWKRDFRFKQPRTPLGPPVMKQPETRLEPHYPDSVDPVSPDPVKPAMPDRVTPVSPDRVTPNVTPKVAPERVPPAPETDPSRQRPVLKRPVRIPSGIQRPVRTPVLDNEQAEPELR